MAVSEIEVSVKGVQSSLKAAIQNLGQKFEIILLKSSFFNKVAG